MGAQLDLHRAAGTRGEQDHDRSAISSLCDEEVLQRAHRRSPAREVDVDDVATLRERDGVQAEAPALANGHQFEGVDSPKVVTARY